MGRRSFATVVFLVLGLVLACGSQAGSTRGGEIATLAGGCFWGCLEGWG